MALVADGVDKGKLCVIIDVINQRTVSSAHKRTTIYSYPIEWVIVLRYALGKPIECALFRVEAPPTNYPCRPAPQALVDGPCTGVRRQAMNFNKLWLTDFKIRISPSAREKQVRKRFVEGDIGAKWEKTSWAKKIAMKNKRKTLTDFHRFKLKILKQQVGKQLMRFK